MNKTTHHSLAFAALALSAMGAQAALLYDQNVTSNVIFGSGNTNGSFTVDRSTSGVELGLRGKLRHNAAGQPENTFNSLGDGRYAFAAGVAPTQASPTAVWSFEWSINTDYVGGTGNQLDFYTYQLGLDTDPSQATSFAVTFDPIHAIEPLAGTVCWDHAMGDNATGQSAGVSIPANAQCRNPDPLVAANAALDYATNISDYNLAQNSWKAHWFMGPGFDPTIDATYDIYLAAFAPGGGEVARTSIQIIVGNGGTVPEPGSLALAGMALLGLAASRRRIQR